MVEQRTENPRVVGSIPTGGTNADLAHLVERRLAKAKVAGSSPVIRSKKKEHQATLGVLSFLLSSFFLRSNHFDACFPWGGNEGGNEHQKMTVKVD